MKCRSCGKDVFRHSMDDLVDHAQGPGDEYPEVLAWARQKGFVFGHGYDMGVYTLQFDRGNFVRTETPVLVLYQHYLAKVMPKPKEPEPEAEADED